MGDKVEVLRGEYRGLQGRVTELSELTIGVYNTGSPTSPFTQKNIDIPREEIRRVLSVGDHIIVKAGPSKGRVGLIISLDGDEATFIARYRRPTEEPLTPVCSLHVIIKEHLPTDYV